jgi:5,10-methylenetetrahydrofolate reductase
MSLEKLQSSSAPGDRPVICLELNPPRGAVAETVLQRLDGQLAGIDFLNVTDSALARMRMAAIPFASFIKQRLGIEVLVNLSCRDRNVLALQADLLAGWLLGVRSVVALTGDAMTVGDNPERKGVFEVNSIGLLGIINTLKAGHDLAGNKLDGCPQFLSGVVVNPNVKNPAAELRRLEKKKLAGASYALSQPVFDGERALEFFSEANKLGLPCLAGLMPWKTGKGGLALTNVPGIKLPAALEAEFQLDAEADWSERSIAHCVQIAKLLRPQVRGFHVISGAAPKLGLQLARNLVGINWEG